MKTAAALVLLAVACTPPSPGSQDSTIALVPYFRDLRVVHVVVHSDTLAFLLDTGGGATLITPAHAREQGCVPHGRDVGHRMTGETVVFQRCDSLALRSGDWSRTLAPVAVYDVNALLPAELPRLDGVLALDAFREQVITLDWGAGILTVHGPGSASRALASTGLPARPATGLSGRFLSAFVPVTGRGDTLWFLLDSGNLRGTLVATGVLGDSAAAQSGPGMAELRVGRRQPISDRVTAADILLDGVLGTDYLRRGPITLDLRGWTP